MKEQIYWIYSQLALGQGNRKCFLAAEYFGGMKNFYTASEQDLAVSGLFTRIDIEKIKAIDLEDAQRVMQKCENSGIEIVTPEDARYPDRLRNIAAPPAVLYLLGTLPVIDDEVLIAMVGTRAATPYGRKAAQILSMQLAKAGAVIVSGGAVGVDSDAHTGALTVSGRTIAVLGCAINYPYLMENHTLREMIIKNGALLSEYPPGTPPSKTTFPCRNRIISGLSLGTVIIEAGSKSGSLITANHALEQGRDVFVLPGGEGSPNYAGSIRLLEDGAKPVYKAADILEEYVSFYPHRLDMRDVDHMVAAPAMQNEGVVKKKTNKDSKIIPKKTNKDQQTVQIKKKIIPQGVSHSALLVYNAFENDTLHCDMVAEKSGLPIDQVLNGITELEIMGYLEALPGKHYRIL